MKMQFTDGMEFDLEGPYRIEEKNDGFYVVGNGILDPCEDQAEAEEVLKQYQDLEKRLIEAANERKKSCPNAQSMPLAPCKDCGSPYDVHAHEGEEDRLCSVCYAIRTEQKKRR